MTQRAEERDGARRLGWVAGILTLVIGVHELQRTFTGWSAFPDVFANTLPMPRWRAIAHTTTGIALVGLLGLRTNESVRRLAAIAGGVFAALSLASLVVKVWPVVSVAWLQETRAIAGFIGLLEGTGLALAARRRLAAANVLGLAVLTIGGTIVIGYVYGGSVYASSPVVNFAATLLAVSEGVAILTVNGMAGWPFSLVHARPVSARLLRSFLPFVALIVLLTDVATIFVFRDVSALGSAINTTISVVAAAALTIAAGRLIDAQMHRTNASLQENVTELRALSSRMNGIREQERDRIARDVHDHLGQALTALRMDVGETRRRLARGEVDGAATRLAEMDSLVARAIDDVRRVARELRPVLLEDLGFKDAMRAYVSDFQQRSGIQCALTIDGDPGVIDHDRSMALFRILQEALTNVSRHAEAKQVVVRMSVDASDAVLFIADDGKGMAPRAPSQADALGLIGMRDRTRLFSGTLDVAGVPGTGTTVEARIPLGNSP